MSWPRTRGSAVPGATTAPSGGRDVWGPADPRRRPDPDALRLVSARLAAVGDQDVPRAQLGRLRAPGHPRAPRRAVGIPTAGGVLGARFHPQPRDPLSRYRKDSRMHESHLLAAHPRLHLAPLP